MGETTDYCWYSFVSLCIFVFSIVLVSSCNFATILYLVCFCMVGLICGAWTYHVSIVG